MKRFIISGAMNLLVPGTGLIFLGRPWLGVAVTVWFVLGAELAICGFLLAPATIPAPVKVLGLICTFAAWLFAQGVLWSRIRFLADPNLPVELGSLRRLAQEALEKRDFSAARSVLTLALSIDDYDLQTRILWARLQTLTRGRASARRAWLYAARLDRNEKYAPQIREALDRLQTV